MDTIVMFHDGAIATLMDWKDRPVGCDLPPTPFEVWEFARMTMKTEMELLVLTALLRQQNTQQDAKDI